MCSSCFTIHPRRTVFSGCVPKGLFFSWQFKFHPTFGSNQIPSLFISSSEALWQVGLLEHAKGVLRYQEQGWIREVLDRFQQQQVFPRPFLRCLICCCIILCTVFSVILRLARIQRLLLLASMFSAWTCLVSKTRVLLCLKRVSRKPFVGVFASWSSATNFKLRRIQPMYSNSSEA